MSDDVMTAIAQRFDRLEQLTLIGAKPVLNLEETVVFTGFSKGHLYRLTSEKQIPYYKKCRKLYFKKSELEAWLLERRVSTQAEIEAQATTRNSISRQGGRHYD